MLSLPSSICNDSNKHSGVTGCGHVRDLGLHWKENEIEDSGLVYFATSYSEILCTMTPRELMRNDSLPFFQANGPSGVDFFDFDGHQGLAFPRRRLCVVSCRREQVHFDE